MFWTKISSSICMVSWSSLRVEHYVTSECLLRERPKYHDLHVKFEKWEFAKISVKFLTIISLEGLEMDSEKVVAVIVGSFQRYLVFTMFQIHHPEFICRGKEGMSGSDGQPLLSWSPGAVPHHCSYPLFLCCWIWGVDGRANQINLQSWKWGF